MGWRPFWPVGAPGYLHVGVSMAPAGMFIHLPHCSAVTYERSAIEAYRNVNRENKMRCPTTREYSCGVMQVQ